MLLTLFCKVFDKVGLVNRSTRLCATSLLWIWGTYFYIQSRMLNCGFFLSPDTENNGIYFLLLQLVKWSFFSNVTVYCFFLLLCYFLYFRFWRNLPFIFACKKQSSQRMCWELDLISVFFVRCKGQCSSQQCSPHAVVLEKKPTVLPRMGSLGN